MCAEALTTPVIHEHHAKDVLLSFLDGNGLPKLSLSSDKEGLIKEKKKVAALCIIEYQTDQPKGNSRVTEMLKLSYFNIFSNITNS